MKKLLITTLCAGMVCMALKSSEQASPDASNIRTQGEEFSESETH
jgi:hypothetical protein